MGAHRRIEGNAYVVSKEANGTLVDYLAGTDYKDRNGNQQAMNVLYTDAVEQSRSVDVAMVRNGLA